MKDEKREIVEAVKEVRRMAGHVSAGTGDGFAAVEDLLKLLQDDVDSAAKDALANLPACKPARC